jgi:predicted dehydrogenase
MTATPVGIIGCGHVSDIYIPNLQRFPDVDLVCVTDLDVERASKTAARHGLAHRRNVEELLADDGVEIVVNLTPISAHAAVSRQVLAAGKHLYSEKPLADDVVAAIELVRDARERGLVVGCAPDTMLGSSFQAALRALADGAIGQPLAANAVMLHPAVTRASADYSGSTPFLDMAPYYVSALVSLFGPIERVIGATRMVQPGDVPAAPKVGPAIHWTGTLEFASGIAGQLTLAWGTEFRGEVTAVIIYGSHGVIHAANPNNHGDPAFISLYGSADRLEITGSRQMDGLPTNLRGLGVAEMARAIREGRTPRASADIACHVVEAIEGIVRSASTGTRVDLTSTFAPPAPIDPDEQAALLGVSRTTG